jgi:hypothetical protein
MCRSIGPLFNFDPPVTDEEIRAASLQFVRKIGGFQKPSRADEASFQAAVDEIANASTRAKNWRADDLDQCAASFIGKPGKPLPASPGSSVSP